MLLKSPMPTHGIENERQGANWIWRNAELIRKSIRRRLRRLIVTVKLQWQSTNCCDVPIIVMYQLLYCRRRNYFLKMRFVSKRPLRVCPKWFGSISSALASCAESLSITLCLSRWTWRNSRSRKHVCCSYVSFMASRLCAGIWLNRVAITDLKTWLSPVWLSGANLNRVYEQLTCLNL